MPLAAQFQGISKRYGELQALRDFDLEVRPGEVLGLVGPNGAGKTTALRILCGILPASEGQALVAGHSVHENPLAARRHLAFVPDGAPLYGNLSPLAHLQLVGRLHGLSESDIDQEARRLLNAMDLGERTNDPVGSFSRGMRQKAALACALLPKPDLLILDEPLSGLDAPTALVIKEVLRTWADQGRSVLYTSHLLDVVERVCDRVAIVGRGQLLAVGTLAELRARAGSKSNSEETLEEVFSTLADSGDPAAKAREILGL